MIDDDEGMNNALEYWGDWTDEDPYSNANEVSNVDSAEEMEEEGWKDDYDDYWDGYDFDEGDDVQEEIWRTMKDEGEEENEN